MPKVKEKLTKTITETSQPNKTSAENIDSEILIQENQTQQKKRPEFLIQNEISELESRNDLNKLQTFIEKTKKWSIKLEEEQKKEFNSFMTELVSLILNEDKYNSSITHVWEISAPFLTESKIILLIIINKYDNKITSNNDVKNYKQKYKEYLDSYSNLTIQYIQQLEKYEYPTEHEKKQREKNRNNRYTEIVGNISKIDLDGVRYLLKKLEFTGWQLININKDKIKKEIEDIIIDTLDKNLPKLDNNFNMIKLYDFYKKLYYISSDFWVDNLAWFKDLKTKINKNKEIYNKYLDNNINKLHKEYSLILYNLLPSKDNRKKKEIKEGIKWFYQYANKELNKASNKKQNQYKIKKTPKWVEVIEVQNNNTIQNIIIDMSSFWIYLYEKKTPNKYIHISWFGDFSEIIKYIKLGKLTNFINNEHETQTENRKTIQEFKLDDFFDKNSNIEYLNMIEPSDNIVLEIWFQQTYFAKCLKLHYWDKININNPIITENIEPHLQSSINYNTEYEKYNFKKDFLTKIENLHKQWKNNFYIDLSKHWGDISEDIDLSWKLSWERENELDKILELLRQNKNMKILVHTVACYWNFFRVKLEKEFKENPELSKRVCLFTETKHYTYNKLEKYKREQYIGNIEQVLTASNYQLHLTEALWFSRLLDNNWNYIKDKEWNRIIHNIFQKKYFTIDENLKTKKLIKKQNWKIYWEYNTQKRTYWQMYDYADQQCYKNFAPNAEAIIPSQNNKGYDLFWMHNDNKPIIYPVLN